MLIEVVPGGVLGVFAGVDVVGVREVGVMGGLVMIARVVVLRRFSMVMSGHAVMVGRRAMFVRCLL